MLSKKVLITFVSISLVIHIAILTAVGIIDVRGNHQRRIFTVDLKEPSKDYERTTNKKREAGSSTESGDAKDKSKKARNAAQHEREDTVNLGSMDTKYYSYLKKLRKSIKKNWSYPKQAYIQKEEGTTVVKFSIAENGSLIDICIIASSGFKSLDMEACNVIKTSAPYTPLPKTFNLSKLNIVANFQYRLFE
ncbi:MAG: energy transducer TonB [Euryarchaeota archaeon]|nr:energy transducer TonB [Euryarchaeota archaeon]